MIILIGYGGYGVVFASRSDFSLLEGSMGKKIIIFGVDMSSSVHIDNKKKDILILGIGPTQELDDTMLTAEAQYSINFQYQIENFVQVCIITGAIVFYSLILQKNI